MIKPPPFSLFCFFSPLRAGVSSRCFQISQSISHDTGPMQQHPKSLEPSWHHVMSRIRGLKCYPSSRLSIVAEWLHIPLIVFIGGWENSRKLKRKKPTQLPDCVVWKPVHCISNAKKGSPYFQVIRAGWNKTWGCFPETCWIFFSGTCALNLHS